MAWISILCCSVFFAGTVAVHETVYGRPGRQNTKYEGTASKKVAAKHVLQCARQCKRDAQCWSYNFIKSTEECEMFEESSVQTDPWNNAVEENGADYFEETCQLHTQIRMANVRPGGRVVVIGDGRTSTTYLDVMTDADGSVLSTPELMGVPQVEADGSISHFSTSTGNGAETIITSDDFIFCYKPNLVGLCDGDNKKHMNNVIQNKPSSMSRIDAMIQKQDFRGGYIFSNAKVYEFNIISTFDWEVVAEYTISHVYEAGNPWWNAPLDIVAATWLNENDSDIIWDYRFMLFTNQFYVVYNMTNQEVTYRQQLCVIA